jgi:hypothetical protein
MSERLAALELCERSSQRLDEPMVTPADGTRDPRPWLHLDDAALLAQCKLEVFRGQGPGGQKRNKTSSAVRLVHIPTGLAVRAEETRSQSSNRKLALGRLRIEIALRRRGPVSANPKLLKTLNPKAPPDIAIVLDHLDAAGYVVAEAAESLGATTGALSSFVCESDALLSEVNQRRAAVGLRPMRR